MTIVEKILARANGAATVAPGDLALVDVDLTVRIGLGLSGSSWREVLQARPVPGPLLSLMTGGGVYPVLAARGLIAAAQSSAAPRSGHP
jgi:hypothetical protein